jgi:hypothetical protein
MSKQEDRIFIFLNLLLIALTIGLMNNYNMFEGTITGSATTSDATTYAIIANYFSINASTNMTTDGIKFFISTLPAINKSAHGNSVGDISNGTATFLTVEYDSNVNVKFCLKSNDSLRSADNIIDIYNYYWSNSTINNGTMPHLGDISALNISTAKTFGLNNGTYTQANDVITPGSSDFFRFWLSVGASQNPGTYTNQVNFKGVQTGVAC